MPVTEKWGSKNEKFLRTSYVLLNRYPLPQIMRRSPASQPCKSANCFLAKQELAKGADRGCYPIGAGRLGVGIDEWGNEAPTCFIFSPFCPSPMIAEEFEYLGNGDFSDGDETILYLHFLFKNGDYGETIQVCHSDLSSHLICLGWKNFLSPLQYLIYDIDQLIADVGGYMGLLLGHSALSIYYKLEAWCGKRTIFEIFF